MDKADYIPKSIIGLLYLVIQTDYENGIADQKSDQLFQNAHVALSDNKTKLLLYIPTMSKTYFYFYYVW